MPKTLAGNLDTFSLADLLQWLEMNALSGRVSVTRGDVKRTIDLKAGSIVYVSSTRPDEQLGVFLSNRGLLPDAIVYELLAENFLGGTYLTKLILDRQLLTREKLAAAVETLAIQVLLDLFHWQGAGFEFDPMYKVEDLLNIHLSLRGQVLAFHGAKSLDESGRMRVSAVSMKEIEAPWEKEFEPESVALTFWSVLELSGTDSLTGGAIRDRFYVFNLFAGEVHRRLQGSFQPFPIFDDSAAMLQTVLHEGCDPEHILQVAALDPFLTLDLIYLSNSLLIDPSGLAGTARQAVEMIGGPALRRYVELLSRAEAPKLSSWEKMERAVRRASLSTAVAASHLSYSFELDPEVAYTLGLVEPVGGFDLLKLLIAVDFPPGPFRASSMDRFRPVFGKVLAQKLNLPFSHEVVLGSAGHIGAESTPSEKLILLAKQMAPSDQIGREWASEDPELADRFAALRETPELAEQISRDALVLREILGL